MCHLWHFTTLSTLLVFPPVLHVLLIAGFYFRTFLIFPLFLLSKSPLQCRLMSFYHILLRGYSKFVSLSADLSSHWRLVLIFFPYFTSELKLE